MSLHPPPPAAPQGWAPPPAPRASAAPPGAANAPLLRWLGTACVALWVLALVDGIAPQAQMYLFGGRVLVPSVVIKAALLGLLVAAVPLNPGARVPRGVFAAWIAFTGYLALVAILFLYRFDYSLADVLTSYSGYYFFTLITPLFFYVAGTVPERRIVRTILAVLVPLAVLGIAQQLLADPLVPTRSRDELFQVNQWRWYGLIRGFSLTSSGAQFGHYLSLSAALATVLVLRPRRGARWVGVVLLALTTWATFATLTRGTYLEVLLAAATAGVLCRWPSRWIPRIKALSLGYGVAGALLILSASSLAVTDSEEQTLLGAQSSQVRTERWSTYLGETIVESTPDFFTGTGVVQTREIGDRRLVIDNMPLAVLIHVGLIGLVLWLWLTWQVWAYVVARLRAHPAQVLMLAVAAAMSVWLFRGMIRLAFPYYSLLPMLVILARWNMPTTPPGARSPAPVRGRGRTGYGR